MEVGGPSRPTPRVARWQPRASRATRLRRHPARPTSSTQGIAWQRRLVRRRLRRHPLARSSTAAGASPPTTTRRGSRSARCAGVPPFLNMVGLVLAGGVDPAVRHARAAGASTCAPTLAGRPRVVPAVQRARRRQRPRRPDARGPSATATRFVVNGQKVWCSRRPLQRLGHPHGPHRPVDAPSTRASRSSCSTCDLPGIEVRPLRQMTGEAEFDEVFFTDVAVPADYLLGPLHGGWGVGMAVLTNERGHIGASRDRAGAAARGDAPPGRRPAARPRRAPARWPAAVDAARRITAHGPAAGPDRRRRRRR